jgi:hypothetical protein
LLTYQIAESTDRQILFFNMKNVSKDKPIQPEDASPWADLDELGSGLTVDHFLTTMVSQVINGLRRTVTLPYAEAFGVTVPEWRLLSLLAHAKSLPFAELVVQSTSGHLKSCTRIAWPFQKMAKPLLASKRLLSYSSISAASGA